MSTPFAMDSYWVSALAALLLLVAAMAVARHSRFPRRLWPGTGAAPNASTVQASRDRGAGLDLGSEIRDVLARLEPRAREHQVRFTVAVEPQLIAWADPETFRQVLADLLDHAIRRTPSGSVLVSAGGKTGQIRVAVSDDGPIGDESGARTALRSVSALLEAQGGHLEIDSHPGEGMTVTMQLSDNRTVRSGAVPFARSSPCPSSLPV